jgi:phospholipase C
MGSNIGNVIRYDQNPRADLVDVQHDIFTIAAKNQVVNWGWFQQGFNGHDAADPYEPQGTGTPNPGNDPSLYTGYVLHHNGPQYFGYLADNTQVLANNLHGAQDFLDAVNNRTLPAAGGVFYYRGGYSNNAGLVPVDPTPAIKHAFIGDDDHPAYSDHQISEAFAAEAISAIANSPYWNQSAIIVTYDETDGFYDHEQVQQRSHFVDNSILAGGPRIPTIVISPWSLQGSISHQYSEHGSVIKFINELYNLVPLAQLPDEAHARSLGMTNLGQANLGPSDDPNNNLGDLTEAFDYARMQSNNPIAPSVATFSSTQIHTLPHLAQVGFSPNGYTNGACMAVGILPTDFASQAAYQSGTPIDPYPIDVNPRPSQSPGTPTSGTWTP